jgi:hypothetical protein
MTLSHSPNIVRDGLVLYYDMDNTKKSFKGMPTTNVMQYPEANWNGSSIPLSYNYDATSTRTIDYVTGVSNPINSPGILRYYTGTTGYKYFALMGTVPSAGTYTFSYYARMSNGASSSFGNSQLWRDTGVGDQSVTGDWNPVITNEWTRYVVTSTVTNSLDFFPIHGGSVVGGYTIDYCGFQLEAGSIASPWLNGTRSNTESIIDLTGNNALTSNNLAYSSNNTFSFNGVDSVVDCGNNSYINFGDGDFSVSVWFKRYSSATTNLRLLSKGASGDSANAASAGFCFFGSDTGINFAINPTAARTIIEAANYSLNEWINVVGLIERGSSVRTYKNGNLYASSASAPTGSVTGTSLLKIGNAGSSLFWNGEVSGVKIYNKALSDDEIKQNFNALRGRYGI